MACVIQNSSVSDSNSSSAWTPLYGGGGKLDKDAIQLIHKFYCKDCQMEEQAAERAKAQSSSKAAANSPYHREPTSPVLDQHSLTQSLDKNKESLKRKLMLRRSVNELVDRGIYPPLKTPPAYAEQRKQLERAKAGDLLRRKIQQRPDRQSLVQQHILEDTTIAPSLQERQRLLKKSKLSDELNEKLSHRPGPLDLIKGNILQADNKMIVDAIKGNNGLQMYDDDYYDGSLHFDGIEPSDEDDQSRQITFDDDTNTSDGAPSPQDSNMSEIGSPVPVTIPTLLDMPQFFQQTSPQPTVVLPQVSRSPQLSSPPIIPQTSNILAKSPCNMISSSNNNNNKARPKKPKPKSIPKAKVIKFHEYKGPPNIVKTQNANDKDSETPYHVMLQQQQLFLQWQLEFQQKNNFLLAPAEPEDTLIPIAPQPAPNSSSTVVTSTSPKPTTTQTVQTPVIVQATTQAIPTPVPQQIIQTVQKSVTPQIPVPTMIASKSPSPQPVPLPSIVAVKSPKIYGNLEDLKVADLKVELKKRNLPVSGSKPQLIQRLSPYHETGAKSPSHTVVTPAPSPAPSISSIGSTIESIGSPPLAKVGATIGTVINVHSQPMPQVQQSQQQPKVKEEPMSRNNSPPTSPLLMESNPLSPDMMDVSIPSTVTLTNQAKIHFSPQPPLSSVSPIPTPNSTPIHTPAQVPTSVTAPIIRTPEQQVLPVQANIIKTEATPMDVDQTNVDTLSTAFINQQLQLQMQQVKQLIQQTQQQQSQQQPQLSQDELLRQQQSQIEELQRQLQESQMKLKLQALQQQQIQLQQQSQLLQQSNLMQQQPVTSQTLINNQANLLNSQSQLVNSQTPMVNAIQIIRPDSKISTQLQNSQTKQIQIPASLLQANLQNNNHGVPAVILTGNGDPTKQSKTTFADYLRLNQSLQNGNKPEIMTSTSTINNQPYIFTTATTNIKTTNPLPINGIHRTTSLPVTSLDSQKIPVIERSPSNPYFNVPLKEPPKYDEAIRSKQVKQQKDEPMVPSPPCGNPHIVTQGNPNKSQAMDDVLEILIRHGDLPPNAAEEALPTPKTTQAQPLPPVASMPSNIAASSSSSSFRLESILASSGINIAAPTALPISSLTPPPPTITTPSTINDVLQMTAEKSNRIETPPPPQVVVSMPLSDNNNELLDLSEMLDAGDLNSMDWTNDNAFSNLDLYAATLADQLNSVSDPQTMLNVPTSSDKDDSAHGSEPDLASLGLSDQDAANNMQIDVSDWLDVIMPSTGLTPLTTNAPVSFSSDPILTPKTQQEVLELFNFDDTDFSAPSDSVNGINWEKLTDPGTSSS